MHKILLNWYFLLHPLRFPLTEFNKILKCLLVTYNCLFNIIKKIVFKGFPRDYLDKIKMIVYSRIVFNFFQFISNLLL